MNSSGPLEPGPGYDVPSEPPSRRPWVQPLMLRDCKKSFLYLQRNIEEQHHIQHSIRDIVYSISGEQITAQK